MTMTEEQLAQIWSSVEERLGGLDRIQGPPLTDRHREVFEGRVPRTMIRAWETYGFSGFQNGLMWLCDPLEWQPAADSWTRDLNLAMGPDTFFPVTRSAFGSMSMWGERTGHGLSIYPLDNQVMPMDNSDLVEDELGREIAALTAVGVVARPGHHDIYDEDEKHQLFETCLAAHGQLAVDEMYTFAPVPALGGEKRLENVIIEKAVPHVMLLAQLSSVEVTGDIVATMRAREASMDEWLKGED